MKDWKKEGTTKVYHPTISIDEYYQNEDFYKQFKPTLRFNSGAQFDLDINEMEKFSDFRGNQIQKKEENFVDEMNELVGKIVEQKRIVEKHSYIDDILLIHGHHYENYEEYVESKKRQIEAIRQENQKNTKSFFEGEPIYNFTIYVEPTILDMETFNYIIGEKNNER